MKNKKPKTSFFNECRKIGKNQTYIALVIIILAIYLIPNLNTLKASELDKYSKENPFAKPIQVEDFNKYYEENGKYPYGITNEEVKEDIIPTAIISLYNEYTDNSYTTYPFGYYKEVKLNDSKNSKIKDILENLTGKNISEFTKENINGIVASVSIQYDKFKNIIKKANSIIGRNSNYSEDNLIKFSTRPITYEEALDNYNQFINKEKVTNRYAKMFTKQIIKPLIILSLGFVLYLFAKNKKDYIDLKTLKIKKISLKDFTPKYLSIVSMIMIPIIFLAIFLTIKFIFIGNNLDVAISYFAFMKYSLLVILPIVMLSDILGIGGIILYIKLARYTKRNKIRNKLNVG